MPGSYRHHLPQPKFNKDHNRTLEETPSDIGRLSDARERRRPVNATRECCRRAFNRCLSLSCVSYLCLRCVLPLCYTDDKDDDKTGRKEELVKATDIPLIKKQNVVFCEVGHSDNQVTDHINSPVEQTYIGIIPDTYSNCQQRQAMLANGNHSPVCQDSNNELNFESTKEKYTVIENKELGLSNIGTIETDTRWTRGDDNAEIQIPCSSTPHCIVLLQTDI